MTKVVAQTRCEPVLIINYYTLLVEVVPVRRRYFPSPLRDKKKAVITLLLLHLPLSPTIFENQPGVTAGWKKNNTSFFTNLFQSYL